MDTIFKMVVLTWLLSAMPYLANAAAMNESTTPYTNSTQSSNEDCDLSLQQCVVIHGRSNDCYIDKLGQTEACVSICNPDDYKQKCKRLCPEFTYTGKKCEDSMFTSTNITSSATTTDNNAPARATTIIAIVGTPLALLVLFMVVAAVCVHKKRDGKYEDEEDHANKLVKYLDKRGPMEGYHPVPDGIKEFISGVAQEQEVECGAIYQCPLHPKELEIIGMHTSSMSDVIKHSMSEFPGYSFTIHESSDPRHHVEFSGNDIFSVSKGVWQSGRDSETNEPCKVLNGAGSSQCGLILIGSAVANNTVNAYYVVVPAHLVLHDALNESLLEVTNTMTMEEMRKQVLSTADKTMYTLHMHNSSTNTCNIQPIPLFAYRHFIPRDSSEQRFGQFTNDLAILKIETDQTRDEERTGIIPLSKIVSAMQQKFGIASEEQATVIDDIFPLQYPDTLIEMARVGVLVLIGSEPIKGHLVPCGDPLSIDGRTWSLAIEFITYSWELKEGDCGLILYVQDTREGKRLYPFGMFIGKSLRKHCCGQTIYRAVVLRQALDEIQSHYDHQVANLRPIGRADNHETDGANWVPDLRQLGEEEHYGLCLQATNSFVEYEDVSVIRSIHQDNSATSSFTEYVDVSVIRSIHQASD